MKGLNKMGSFGDNTKAIIYVRVSTKEQVEEGNSLDTQERLCLEYATKNDITVLEDGVFIEQGESAKTALRTELQKMLKYSSLNKDKIDCLIIYRIDRLSRDTKDYGDLKVFFNTLGIRVVSISEAFDDDPVGRFIENTLAGVAQLDNEIRAERSKNGMIDAVRAGRWVWKAPYGYVNARVNGSTNVKPDNENNTSTLLREAWELVDAGYSIEAARQMLTKKGLRNSMGKPVAQSSFYKIFYHPLYKGVIDRFGLNIVSDSIEPIVDAELFDRVLNRLTGAKSVPNKYQKANPEFPLRGIVYCDRGHRMTASSPRGNGGKYPKYHCSQCRGKGTSHDKALLEDKFVQLLNGFEYQTELKDALVVAIEENWAHDRQSQKKHITKLKKRLTQLDAVDDEIARKNIMGVFTNEHTKKLLAQNSLERTQLKLDLSQYDYLDRDLEHVIEFGASTLENMGIIWQQLDDIFVKQRFQKWLFPAGIVWNGQDFGTSQIHLCLSIKKDLSEEKSLVVIPRRVELLLPG